MEKVKTKSLVKIHNTTPAKAKIIAKPKMNRSSSGSSLPYFSFDWNALNEILKKEADSDPTKNSGLDKGEPEITETGTSYQNIQKNKEQGKSEKK